MNIKERIAKLTVEEKAMLLTGAKSLDPRSSRAWHSPIFAALGHPGMWT